MTAPNLTLAFEMFVTVALPADMAPGNEISHLTVVNGVSLYDDFESGTLTKRRRYRIYRAC
jgi:hypothetical protein